MSTDDLFRLVFAVLLTLLFVCVGVVLLVVSLRRQVEALKSELASIQARTGSVESDVARLRSRVVMRSTIRAHESRLGGDVDGGYPEPEPGEVDRIESEDRSKGSDS